MNGFIFCELTWLIINWKSSFSALKEKKNLFLHRNGSETTQFYVSSILVHVTLFPTILTHVIFYMSIYANTCLNRKSFLT